MGAAQPSIFPEVLDFLSKAALRPYCASSAFLEGIGSLEESRLEGADTGRGERLSKFYHSHSLIQNFHIMRAQYW